jgi:hypothetical protein
MHTIGKGTAVAGKRWQRLWLAPALGRRVALYWDHVAVWSQPGKGKARELQLLHKTKWNANDPFRPTWGTTTRLWRGHVFGECQTMSGAVPTLSESKAVGRQGSLTSLVRPAISKAADDAVAGCFFFNNQ